MTGIASSAPVASSTVVTLGSILPVGSLSASATLGTTKKQSRATARTRILGFIVLASTSVLPRPAGLLGAGGR